MKNRIILSLLIVLGLPIGLGAQQPIPLSRQQAVEAALEPNGNTRIQLAREMVRQEEARAAQVRADLLPDFSASISQQSQTRSLTAFGLRSETLPTGFDLPGVVGPFNTFDARGTISQKLFDLSSIRRYQAARVGTEAARQESESTKDDTAAQVARAYLAAVRAQAVVETAQANIELSEALLRLANSQKQAGTGTGIEITRAQVQLANDRQTMLVSQADFIKARLELLKALGIDLDVPVQLTDPLSYKPAARTSLKEAMGTASESLAALKAQHKREESASLTLSATTFERLFARKRSERWNN